MVDHWCWLMNSSATYRTLSTPPSSWQTSSYNFLISGCIFLRISQNRSQARWQQRQAMAQYPLTNDLLFPTGLFLNLRQLSYLSKILIQQGMSSRWSILTICSFFFQPLLRDSSEVSWSMQLITFSFSSGRRSLRTSSMRSEQVRKSSSLVSCSSPTSQVMWQSLIFWFWICSVWQATRSGCSIFSQRLPFVLASPQIYWFSFRASITVLQQRRQKRSCFFIYSSRLFSRSRLIRVVLALGINIICDVLVITLAFLWRMRHQKLSDFLQLLEMARIGTASRSLAAQVLLQLLIVKILDGPGSFVIGCYLLEFAGLCEVHFGEVLIFDVAEVGVAVVDEFALDGLVVFLVADYAALVELCAVLLNYVGAFPTRARSLQFSTTRSRV